MEIKKRSHVPASEKIKDKSKKTKVKRKRLRMLDNQVITLSLYPFIRLKIGQIIEF